MCTRSWAALLPALLLGRGPYDSGIMGLGWVHRAGDDSGLGWVVYENSCSRASAQLTGGRVASMLEVRGLE